jgi:dihydropteroate synthase
MSIRMKLKKILIGDNLPVRIMGIINYSPESFYKPSIVNNLSSISKFVLQLIDSGSDIIDLGAASTAPNNYYPGSFYVSELEEKERIKKALPIIRDLGDFQLSVDTLRASVAEQALKMGADIINDVSGLKKDENMLSVIKEYKPYLILMASKKQPGDIKTIKDIITSLKKSIDLALDSGIPKNKIIIDPGFGFGKSVKLNMKILDSLGLIRTLGMPILAGVSRKGFIREIINSNNDNDILIGSIVASIIAVLKGSHIIRTHDVRETKHVMKILDYISNI